MTSMHFPTHKGYVQRFSFFSLLKGNLPCLRMEMKAEVRECHILRTGMESQAFPLQQGIW